jgi:glycosyltransferase involved in cell wall biosynthesis
MMNSEPLVSIIIPTYNCGRFLSDAIESGLAQTYPRIEIIVVDDGSTDNTGSVAAKYEDRVTYMVQRNEGPASARNAGIVASKGDYLVFLDSDDRLLPEMVERLTGKLETHRDYDVACSGWYITDSELRRIGQAKVTVPEGRFFETMLREGGYLITDGAVVRRSIVDVAGPFDTELPNFEDWEFWVRVSYFGKFKFVPEPLVEYRQLPASRSRAFREFSESTAKVAAKVNSFLEAHEEPVALTRLAWANWRSVRRSLLTQNCFLSYWSGQYESACKYAGKAMLSSPGNLLNRGVWSVLLRSLLRWQTGKWVGLVTGRKPIRRNPEQEANGESL